MPKNNKSLLHWGSIVGTACIALGLSGCGSSDPGASGGSGPVENPKPVVHTTCNTPPNMELTDMQSLVKWINALPKPTTVPCFVESLPRPLYINLSTSQFSAQPSTSERDPRVFIFYGDLTLSVVTDHDAENTTDDGTDFNLLEISVLTTDVTNLADDEDIMSIKGELVFPVKEDLKPEAPHERVVLSFTESTSGCGLCHSRVGKLEETVGESKTPIFQSVALKPFSSLGFELEALRGEYAKCDSATESFRCLMMSSLLDYGDVYEQDFPERMLEFGSPSWRKGA